MEKFVVKISKSFEKDFNKLESLVQNKILIALEKMQINPFYNTKKLKNVEIGTYRVRIGDYRLRFDIIKNEIYLYRIRHRKDVYR